MALELRLLEEIRTFFNNDFVINLSDLQKPTYVFVRDFYARALIEFEVDTDNVRKASHLLEGMDNTVEIAGDLNLVAAINKTFNFLNFGLFDLLSPGENNKRTVAMISAVMEFLTMADDLTSRLDFEAYKNMREQLIHQADQAEAMRQKLSEIALSKDRVVQARISMMNELAKTKMQEQQICSEVDVSVKEENAAKMKLEERLEMLKAKKAEVEKLKSSINLLKDELVGAQSLDLKEAERDKVEQEKAELNAKYLEKVDARKKYATALDAIKPFTAVANDAFGLFDEIGGVQESVLALRKETASMKQTHASKKKQFSWLENEAVDLQKKSDLMKSDKKSSKEELTKNIGNLTGKSSELAESIRTTIEEVAASEENLDALKKEGDQSRVMFLEYVDKLNRDIKRLGGSSSK